MRWLLRVALCLALSLSVLPAGPAHATNLFARRYGLDQNQLTRPWWTRPWSYRNFYNRPWYTLPYRYLYQSFGYNVPDPLVGNWPPVFVALDALPGYPFLDYNASPAAWPDPCALEAFVDPMPTAAELLDEEALREDAAIIEGAELSGCYYW
jgi:hypothetical protein